MESTNEDQLYYQTEANSVLRGLRIKTRCDLPQKCKGGST